MTRIALILGVLLSAIVAQSAEVAARSLEERRMHRWQQWAVSPARPLAFGEDFVSQLRFAVRGVSNASDIRVYDDDVPASFQQRYPDIARFSNGNALAVWEDERNGDWDIVALMFAGDTIVSGNRYDLVNDDLFYSQRQPRVAVDGNDNLVLVWTEEETAHTYASVLDSDLNPILQKLQVDDAPSGNATNAPAVAAFSGGGFIVVWEDVRAGGNIYGQLLSSAGSTVGGNFRINENVPSSVRLAPGVTTAADGSFAVTWEDTRDGESDVYVRLFDASGTPLSGDIKPADAAYEGSYQFNGQLAHLPGTGYLAAWISDRDGGQGVYAQLMSETGSLIGTNYRLNVSVTDVCWGLRATKIDDGRGACIWTNLSAMAEIVLQVIAADGSPSGTNRQVQDVLVSGERGVPALALSSSGGQVVWSDRRNYHSDIYGQQLDSSFDKLGDNILLNDDATGSQQLSPHLTSLPGGQLAVVWQDQQNDEGDIFMRLLDLDGSPVGVPQRLNDDAFRAVQAQPRIASSYPTGIAVAVWEDRRGDGFLSGQNIFGQRFEAGGVLSGSNFLVNDDGTSSPKYDPDVAVADDGLFVVVWADERTGKKEIYLRVYSDVGQPLGTDRLLSDVAESSENYAPKVSMRGDGSFIVTWRATISGRRVQFYQPFDISTDPISAIRLLAVDTSQIDILGADVFAHRSSGYFFIAVIDSQATGQSVHVQKYDLNGDYTGVDAFVIDGGGSRIEQLSLTGDVDDALAVSWIDWRDWQRRGYLQLIHENGFLIDGPVRISQNQAPAREQTPALTMRDGFYLSLWLDNRNHGRGFDLFVNSVQYTETGAPVVENPIPMMMVLEQNHPNPFNLSTVISYRLPKPGYTSLEIFNITGQLVKILVNEFQPAGVYKTEWNGADRHGKEAPAGVYFYRLKNEEQSLTKKMILLK